MLGRCLGFGRQCLERHFPVADRHPAIDGPNGLPARRQVEKGDGAFVRRDLRVVAAIDEGLPGAARQLGRVSGMGDLAREHVTGQRLGGRVRGVVHHEAERSQDGFEPDAEGLGHAAARPIGAPQRRDQLVAELGLRQRRGQGVDGRNDVVGE